MAAVAGSRSRDGCLGCRRKRRRCDKRRPQCGACGRTGVTCVFPPRPSASTPEKFVVLESDGYHFARIRPNGRDVLFVNLTTLQLATIWRKSLHHDAEPDGEQTSLEADESWWTEESNTNRSLIRQPQWAHGLGERTGAAHGSQHLLIQYCETSRLLLDRSLHSDL